MLLFLKGKISNLYKHHPLLSSNLETFDFNKFNINNASSSGIIKFSSSNILAYSKWVSPKRTRSYPFARIYDTLQHTGKKITIIPVIKDEGKGESKNKSNNDRINFITLSWMNLMNVYIILAWYENAERLNEYRITNQLFNNEYVIKKISEIESYMLDAHHWNNQHFTNDFPFVFNKAVDSYRKISSDLSVKMNDEKNHISFLEKILSTDKKTLDLKKFAQTTLSKSQLAAKREIVTTHALEHLKNKEVKGLFELTNNLGGKYYLTCDEVILKDKNHIVLQEAKNSSKGEKIPKLGDIKDGIFKLILFSQLSYITLNDKKINFFVSLKLTGNLKTKIELPVNQNALEKYVKENSLEKKLVEKLNKEAEQNKFSIFLEPNK